MNIQTTPAPFSASSEPIPPLRPGDRLTRAEFERRYQAMPETQKAELLDGVVYMASPVSLTHCAPHFNLIGWLGFYKFGTPGVEGGDNGTVRLALDSEFQPDAFLRILESHGGQSRVDADNFIAGSPELVAEIAVSSVYVDLNVKLPIYRRHHVREYILWRVPDDQLDWFVLRGEEYEQLTPGEDDIVRSEVFPGLWLDVAALLRSEPTLLHVLQAGLASPEHAAFVQRLTDEATRRRTQS